jgi:hypothetical protein
MRFLIASLFLVGLLAGCNGGGSSPRRHAPGPFALAAGDR